MAYKPNPEEDVNNVVIGCPHLTEVFEEYSERLLQAEEEGLLPDLHASFTVEEFQHNVIRIEPHVEGTDAESGLFKVYSRHFFLHAERTQEE